MMPRLTVFGLGYLGTVHAACMAQAGFEVLGVDLSHASTPSREPSTTHPEGSG